MKLWSIHPKSGLGLEISRCSSCHTLPRLTVRQNTSGSHCFYLLDSCWCDQKRERFETIEALQESVQVWNVIQALRAK